MSKYSKKEIIRGIITFNRGIYKYLDTAYREKVIGHVLRNSGTREDGDNGRGTYEGYFWTITRRRWIDKLRQSKPDFEPLDPDIEIPYEPEKEVEYLKNERILMMGKYIERLLPDEQEYIRMYYFAKESIQTIADYFGTTYGAARKKLYTIRRKLKKMMDDDGLEFGTSLF